LSLKIVLHKMWIPLIIISDKTVEVMEIVWLSCKDETSDKNWFSTDYKEVMQQ